MQTKTRTRTKTETETETTAGLPDAAKPAALADDGEHAALRRGRSSLTSSSVARRDQRTPVAVHWLLRVFLTSARLRFPASPFLRFVLQRWQSGLCGRVWMVHCAYLFHGSSEFSVFFLRAACLSVCADCLAPAQGPGCSPPIAARLRSSWRPCGTAGHSIRQRTVVQIDDAHVPLLAHTPSCLGGRRPLSCPPRPLPLADCFPCPPRPPGLSCTKRSRASSNSFPFKTRSRTAVSRK